MYTRFNPRTFLLVVLLSGWFFSMGTAQARGLPDFTDLVEKHSAAVVNISTTQKRNARRVWPHNFELPELPEDSPFSDLLRRFLGQPGEGEGAGEEEPQYESQSLGSGFIVSRDGYVVTNNHVISDSDEIIVKLNDRRELEAQLIGTDERSDLALLKIDADNLPVVKFGESDDLKVGEWVLAIGSPFGFDHSVTAGIVSAKGRSLPSENYVPFIQTDVAINPGNSGGPLFNLDGEVVGVNSQIYSRTGGFMGLSFAIPIDMAREVVEQLKSNGRVSRGWLGVLIQDVTRELAESFGTGRPRGALIAKVVPDSPAGDAGFQPGDIVLKFNKHDIDLSSDLPPIVGRTPVGRKIPVQILRQGKEKTLYVQIAELPEEEVVQLAAGPAKAESMADSRLGLSARDLSAEQRETLGVAENGVLVTKVRNGAALHAGLREGDVILMLNNEKIKNLKHFKALAKSLPDNRSVPVLVQRQGSPVFLALKVE